MIVKIPNPVLLKPAKPVRRIDKKVLQVIEKLKKALVEADKPKGVGLAAPQIGISLAVFIAKPTPSSSILVFINPQITWKSKETSEIKRPEEKKPGIAKEKKLEGCLSVSNVWGYLKRPSKVRMKYMNTTGKWQEKEFDGFIATIIQHEVDHLAGILFTQRVLEQNEKLYSVEKNGKEEEKLVEIKI